MIDTVKRTRFLTEAAAAAAISTMLVLLKLVAPFLVIITMLAAPIPIIIITKEQGFKYGFVTAVVVVLLTTLTGGAPTGLTTSVYAGVLGTIIGYGFRVKWSYKKIWAIATMGYLVEMAYKFVIFIYVLGIADAFSVILDRFIHGAQWIGNAVVHWLSIPVELTPESMLPFALFGVLMMFIVNGACYVYLNMELSQELMKRMRGGLRG